MDTTSTLRNTIWRFGIFLALCHGTWSHGEICFQPVRCLNGDTTLSRPTGQRIVQSQRAVTDDEQAALEQAAGSGDGKHGRKVKRTKRNKYADKSRVEGKLDPFEAQHITSKAYEDSLNNKQIRISLPVEPSADPLLYPDDRFIDPYNPATFGFMNVGTVIGAHGVKGDVTVLVDDEEYAEWILCEKGAKAVLHLKPEWRRYPRERIRLVEGRRTGTPDRFIVRLSGIEDRDAAGKLKSHKLYTRRSECLKDLQEDEYLIDQIVGLDVIHSATGDLLGKVRGIVTRDEVFGRVDGGHDFIDLQVLQTTPSEPVQSCLVPMVPSIVVMIDLGAALVKLNPPEGLLDLAVRRQRKLRVRALLPPSKSE